MNTPTTRLPAYEFEPELPPPPSGFTRLLWYCAGADARLLLKCPQSDRVKMQGIGGVVLATAVLAFASGSYAFYAVFSPKEATALDPSQTSTHLPTLVISLLAGAVWSLIIFNIDRFIVSSTGKGDGTDKITLGEFGRAIPRIVMAGVIGICLSAPLEIRILKPEIDAELSQQQKDYIKSLNEKTDASFDAKVSEVNASISKKEIAIREKNAHFETRRLEIKAKGDEADLEAQGKTAHAMPGEGPAYRAIKESLARLQRELDNDKAAWAPEEKRLREEIAQLEADKERVKQEKEETRLVNARQANNLDGLMKRIHISHAIGGLVPWMIMLLILCIEIGPIFFKMMLVKGLYDYLEENQQLLLKARAGIESAAVVVSDGRSVTQHFDRHHAVEAVLEEERRRAATENRLSEVVHDEYRKLAEQDIRKDPRKYVKSVE